MKASEAPTIQSPAWNEYRSRVIAAVADVENLMRQLDKGINSEVLAEEVAERLELEIDTSASYDSLLKLVRAVRPIACEGLRRTSEQHGGQFQLAL